MNPTGKGVGFRFPGPKQHGMGIDKGNPDNPQVHQEVDHVVINSNGKVIGRDGNPIQGSIKQDTHTWLIFRSRTD